MKISICDDAPQDLARISSFLERYRLKKKLLEQKKRYFYLLDGSDSEVTSLLSEYETLLLSRQEDWHIRREQ